MQTFSLRDLEKKENPPTQRKNKQNPTQNKKPHMYKFFTSLSKTRMLAHGSLQSKRAA